MMLPYNRRFRRELLAETTKLKSASVDVHNVGVKRSDERVKPRQVAPGLQCSGSTIVDEQIRHSVLFELFLGVEPLNHRHRGGTRPAHCFAPRRNGAIGIQQRTGILQTFVVVISEINEMH